MKVQEILKEIGAWEPENPQLRDVGDLPIQRVGEREGTGKCSACGEGLEEGKYKCTCGSVNFQAFPKDAEALRVVEDAISESNQHESCLQPKPCLQPEPCPQSEPSPIKPQGHSPSYWTAAMIVIGLLGIYIVRKLR